MLREMSLTIALLFLTSGVLTNAQSEGAGAVAAGGATDIAEDTPQVVYFDINRNFVLVCPIEADKDGYKWSKGNESVSEVAALKDRFQLEEGGAQFRLPHKAHEDDYGVYQCAAGGQRRAFDVRARPLVRLPDNTNVVENQNIKLQCKVLGKPTPRVWWTYNKTEDSNESRPLTTDGRITLLPNEQGVADATLELREAARADAGLYACHAAAADGAAVRDHTTLRVKDMYAALWPFLGICAEVFVLCAIILVYEKRRTKPELDDSDTDNHDQKKS